MPLASLPETDFLAIRDAGYPSAATWQVLSSSIIEKKRSDWKPCITRSDEVRPHSSLGECLRRSSPRSINLAPPDFLVMNGTAGGGRSGAHAQTGT